ncbi:MAG: GTP-binding protein [Acidiferrobacterales bacterium]
MSFVDQEAAKATGVSLIAGFLGSGKTTLLNYLLAHPEMDQTAVLVNEFGEVGLDHLLVRELDENVVLLKSGCICCTVQGELVDGLKELYMKRLAGSIPAFARVAIETTGLADPLPIVTCLMRDPLFKHVYRLDGLITTVDAVHGTAQLDDHAEAVRQAAVADRLIVTKVDLANADDVDALRGRLHKLNPGAKIIPTRFGQVPPRRLFDASLFNPENKSPDVQHWLNEEAYAAADQAGDGHDHRHIDVNRHDEHIAAFCITLDKPVDWEAFKRWYEHLAERKGDSMLRVKGIVNIAGEDEPFAVHCVQSTQHAPARLPAWPNGNRCSKIVFIVRDLAREDIEESLRACVNVATERSSATKLGETAKPNRSDTPTPRERWLNDAELSGLFRALLSESNVNAANAIRLVLLTGTHINEVLGATWDQIDLDEGVWTKPTRVLGKPMPRKIVLNALAQVVLKHMRRTNPNSKYLFPDASANRPLSNVEVSWARAIATAEIADAELQNLRPTFGKHLFDGLPKPVVHRLLGLPEGTR